MKKTHRVRSVLTAAALALVLTVAVAALAEGPLSTLYNAATALLFDTSNATLTLTADFAYNGRNFKHLEGAYTQAGFDSVMKVLMHAPLSDGTSYDTGYTVVANGSRAYSISAVTPWVYDERPTAPSSAILSTTRLRRTILRLGSALLSTAESAMQDKVETTPLEQGTQYHIALQSGDTPELLNAGGTLLAQVLAERFFGVNYAYELSDPYALYISWDRSPADTVYACLYKKPLPSNFYDILRNYNHALCAEYSRQNVEMEQKIHEICDDLYARYDHGAVVVHSDGSHTYYETLDAYWLANDNLHVIYEDAIASFSAYYAQETGEALPPETAQAIALMANDELYSAYLRMKQQMDEAYLDQLRQDGTAAWLFVHKDGSTEPIHDVNAFSKSMNETNNSVTDKILSTMRGLALGETDVNATLDAQGRLTAASGTVRLVVTDCWDTRNTLDITFTLTAGDYGTSAVPTFDPADYGVISRQEYLSQDSVNITQLLARSRGLPPAVVMNGVTYPLYDEIQN